MPPLSLEKGQQPAPAKPPRLPRPFILLNIPRTGTSYTTWYVKHADLFSMTSLFGMMHILQHSRLSTKRWWWKRQIQLKSRRPHGHMNFYKRHTRHFELPAHLQSLPAVTILREPISWQVSVYLRDTRSKSVFPLMRKLKKKEYQSFVQKYMGGEASSDAWYNIDLEAYRHFRLNFIRQRVRKFLNITLAADFPIGALGCQALLFLHREPARVFAMHAAEVEEYFSSGRWCQDLVKGWFLRHEQLREDLYRVMLEQLGYRRKVLDAARESTPARMHVSSQQGKERALRELEQKPWLHEEILQDERIYSQYILPLAETPQ